MDTEEKQRIVDLINAHDEANKEFSTAFADDDQLGIERAADYLRRTFADLNEALPPATTPLA